VTEEHGIVCSASATDSHGGRHRFDRQDGHCVVHWSGNRLQSTPLHQFAREGELFRVVYPLWACSCYVPSSSTSKPHVEEEHLLEARSDEVVTKQVTMALRNASWSPSWRQALDLEFCLEMKTGEIPMSGEVHSSSSLSSSVVEPLGCILRGLHRPSKLFGPGSVAGYAGHAGFASNQWAGGGGHAHGSHGGEAYHHGKYPTNGQDEWWNAGWHVPPVHPAPILQHHQQPQQRPKGRLKGGEKECGGNGHVVGGAGGCGCGGASSFGGAAASAAAASQLSATAQEFVPGQPMSSWDGIFQ